MKHAEVFSFLIAALVWTGCSSSPRLERVPEFPVQITNLGAAVNSSEDDFAPALTANGAWLYFTSRRPSPMGRGQQDFWSASRSGDFWDVPVNLGAPVNT